MATEIELKFLDVDHGAVRTKLKSLGAKLRFPRQLYKRVNLDFKDGRLSKQGGWIRLRDEGDKITLTHKIHSRGANQQLKISEFEVVVSSFEDALAFLKSLDVRIKTYQENYRENWKLSLDSGVVEVALDQWPHVKPHIEIELESGQPAAIKDACLALGLNYDDGINDDICPVYMAEYQIENREQLYSLEQGFRFDRPLKFTRISS